MKNILGVIILIGCLIFPNNVIAKETHTYGVTESERQLIEKESNKRNLVEELDYRFTEKETKDVVDYIILIAIIACMLVIIIALNKKTYIVKINNSVFDDEPVKITETIKES